MTKLLILIALLPACGAPFEPSPFSEAGFAGQSEQAGKGGSDAAGSAGVSASAGRLGIQPYGSGGAQSDTSGASGSPNTAMVGGAGMVSWQTPDCLRNFQSKPCARICTDSQSDCQAVLACQLQNPVDKCQQYTNLGLILASEATQECCK